MDKDAYYFPHFSNARQDRKIKRVRKELGLEGYGIYFMLLETLRDEAGFKFPVKDIDLLADEFGTSEQKVRAVVANYELFQIDELEMFFSANMVNYLQPYIDKKIQAKEAVTLRWARKKLEQGRDITQEEAELIRTYNERNSSCNTNKSKVKEIKVNKSKVDKNKEEYNPSEDFDLFWEAYNKKENKKKCIDKYKLLYKKKQLPEIQKHIEIIKSWHKTDKWKGGFQPNPLTWLNGERWEDEINEKSKSTPFNQYQKEDNHRKGKINFEI